MSTNTNHKKNGHFLVLQKQLLRRRLWMLAGIILYMLLYYPVAVVLLIVRSNEMAALQEMNAAKTLAQRLYEVATWIGVQQSFSWVIVIIAAVLAINGFSYLFDMEKQDFYESQPISRMERFWNIYINGFLMYEIPMVIGLFLSIACAAGMKGMNGLILLEAMIQLVRLTACFFAAYSVGILAVMLTGNLIVSGIATAFLLLIDQFILAIFTWLTTNFYCTYSYLSRLTPNFMFSPLYNVMAPSRYVSGQYAVSYYNTCLTSEQLRQLVQTCVKADAANLLIGAGLLLIAVRIYRKRKEEYAGMTVIHRPVRAVIRVVSSVVIALFAGQLVVNLFSSVTSRTGTAFMLLGIIVATVLCAGVIEIIYELNVWKFFGHFGEIVLAVLAATLILLVFRYDLTGYDRYLPKTEDVESAAIYVYNDSNYCYYETAEDISRYDSTEDVLKRMKLTDIEAVERLVEPSMENACRARDGEAEDSWSAIVCYHMKNGKDVYRSICIPYSMDAAVLDAVVASKEYREGLIPIYSDTYVQELSESTGWLVFSDGFGSSAKESGSLYAAFGEAYKKDLEQFYSYTQLSEENAIGKVSFRCTSPYIEQSYDIYPSYVNTLAFLKEHNMLPEKETAEDVEYVSVYEYTDTDTKQARYTDTESIQKILDSSDIQITSNWKKTEELYDFSKDLYVNMKERDYDGVYYSVYFRKGEVPDFVQRDLDASLENDTNTVEGAVAAR